MLTPSRLCYPGEVPPPDVGFALFPVAPNPARGSVVFRYRSGRPIVQLAAGTGPVGAEYFDPPPHFLAIYDASGRFIRTLDPAGLESVPWDGRDASGRAVSSGIYFVKYRYSSNVTTQRFVFLAVPTPEPRPLQVERHERPRDRSRGRRRFVR